MRVLYANGDGRPECEGGLAMIRRIPQSVMAEKARGIAHLANCLAELLDTEHAYWGEAEGRLAAIGGEAEELLRMVRVDAVEYNEEQWGKE